MERKSKSRLLIGGLIVFSALIAIYTYWVFLKSENQAQDWQAFLLNVSTELIGALIVFFFFNLFFFLDDWDLSERVQNLLNRLERERPRAEKFFQKMPDIGAQIQEADGIDMCGVSLTSTISRQFTELRNGLAEGKPVRILIVDPRTTAVEMANARSESQDIAYYKKRLDASLSDIAYLWQKREEFEEEINAGSYQVRLLPYAPSFGLLIFHQARSKGQMNVEIYPHHGGYGKPPIFTLDESNDQLWYQYFLNQFDEMWDYATEWDPEMFKAGAQPEPKIHSQARAQDFLFDYNPDQRDYFEKAGEIYLYGIDLSGSLSLHSSSIQKCLGKANSKIKVILTSKDVYPAKQEKSKKMLQLLLDNENNRGTLEVREYFGTTHFAIMATDPASARGRLQLRMYLPIWEFKPQPQFEIFREQDPYWMNYFLKEFNEIWEASQDITMKLSQPPSEIDELKAVTSS